jgi:hypothetical protein
MTIPAFDHRGLLPPNLNGAGYVCTPEEIETRLVGELGAPVWRLALYNGWDSVRRTVLSLAPTARWWLWGCFVSNHPEPLWGDLEVLSSIVILPVTELPRQLEHLELLMTFIQAAQTNYRVDVGAVFEFEPDDPNHLDTIDELEFKWRPRATLGIADHVTRVLEPAGFLEVLP